MKFQVVLIILGLIWIFCCGCDPYIIEVQPRDMIFFEINPNIQSLIDQRNEWVDSLDSNFVEALGL